VTKLVGFLSRSAKDRGHAWKQHLWKIFDDARTSTSKVGEVLGVKRAFRKRMDRGDEDSAPSLADLGPLLEQFGAQEVLGDVLQALGYELRKVERRASSTSTVLGATAAAIDTAAQVSSETARALADGAISEAEAEIIDQRAAAGIRALQELRTAVASAVVPTLRRSTR
jgi:hypothetical protein